MKILVLSDIHGNLHALEAVLKAAPPHDKILCLGDVVGYGARPNECCAILRERGATTLLGNHDAAALGLLNADWFNGVARRAIDWTREQLSAENREWLYSLVPSLACDESGFEAVHASLRFPLEEYIFDTELAWLSMREMKHSLCFFGHTHVACAFIGEQEAAGRRAPRFVEQRSFPCSGELEWRRDHFTLLNPGSVGQPRDGNPQARAAILDVPGHRIALYGFDYDIDAARQAIIEAGLPRSLGDRLLDGR